MPKTPDEHAGPLIETETIDLDAYSGELDSPGQIAFQDGYIKIKDDYGTVSIRHNEITKAEHDKLTSLIHFIDDGPAEGFYSGAYCETIGGIFPSSIIWYTSSNKLYKIVELNITRDSFKKPITEVWKIYSTEDILLATVTDTINYSGAFEINRERVIE